MFLWCKKNYFYKAYILCSKYSDVDRLTGKETNIEPTQAILRLTECLKHTDRNITADNWFYSMELVNCIRRWGVKFVAILNKNKKKILKEFQAYKAREI